MKKIALNLSAMDYGGAGTFSVNFNNLLISAGYSSFLIAKDVRQTNPIVKKYPKKKYEQILNKLFRKFSKLVLSSKYFEKDKYFYGLYERYTTVSAKTILSLLPAKPDVIFIHWVANFINAKIVNELHEITGAKIVYLMLDNAPITGGCHFPWECQKFKRKCENCPAIHKPVLNSIARKNLIFKKKYLPTNSTLLVFSQNDFERGRSSSLFIEKKIIKMPGYFVDEIKFCPGNKEIARAKFSISNEQTVVFFGATAIADKRKGVKILIEALQHLKLENITLLIAGTSKGMFSIPNTKLVGNLSESDLIMAYQAADMFVCPSLEDSGPTMINQAMMCGTPVVSFGTGLGRDLVQTGHTGYQAQFANPLDLAKGIEFIFNLGERERESLASNCRELALKLYGGSVNYREVVKNLMEN